MLQKRTYLKFTKAILIKIIFGSIILLNLVLSGYSQEQSNTIPSCTLLESNIKWLQKAFDSWQKVSNNYLKLQPKQIPWIVVFDENCVWNFNPNVKMLPKESFQITTSLTSRGQSIPIYANHHQGTITLPNNLTIPSQIMAAAFPYNGGKDAFYVLASLDLWHKNPQASKDPLLDERILSATLHEMTHTRQLSTLSNQVAKLGKIYNLPKSFDDNIVETNFKSVPEYRELFEKECALFYQAAREKNYAKRRSLVLQALNVVKKRHLQFFQNENEKFAKLEGLFLNMEGAAEWVRFKFHQSQKNKFKDDDEIISFIRGKENDWAQDEGLALVLLLEKTVPNWQKRILGDEMASPFDLLRSAIREDSSERKIN